MYLSVVLILTKTYHPQEVAYIPDYIRSSVNQEQMQLRASAVIKGLGAAQLS